MLPSDSCIWWDVFREIAVQIADIIKVVRRAVGKS